MFEGHLRLFLDLVWRLRCSWCRLPLAVAQNADGVSDLKLPGISSYARPPKKRNTAGFGGSGAITLSAQLTDKGARHHPRHRLAGLQA